jgi:hypothetical protein
MKSTLTIKDLALDKELGSEAMSAVRGGLANQANGTQQSNAQAMEAPVAVGNFSGFGGVATIQVDAYTTQTASNYSTSSNSQGGEWSPDYRTYC